MYDMYVSPLGEVCMGDDEGDQSVCWLSKRVNFFFFPLQFNN